MQSPNGRINQLCGGLRRAANEIDGLVTEMMQEREKLLKELSRAEQDKESLIKRLHDYEPPVFPLGVSHRAPPESDG
jgi:SMC interacting uncharacterized protein involved in chromosome segregation